MPLAIWSVRYCSIVMDWACRLRASLGTEFEDGAVIFFKMNEDLLLALYPKAALVKGAKVPASPEGHAPFSIGHVVGSSAEVNHMERFLQFQL